LCFEVLDLRRSVRPPLPCQAKPRARSLQNSKVTLSGSTELLRCIVLARVSTAVASCCGRATGLQPASAWTIYMTQQRVSEQFTHTDIYPPRQW
jgi:hypothetical protein